MCGYLGLSPAISGYLRLSRAISGFLRLSWDISCCLQLSLAIKGSAFLGYLWRFQGILGYHSLPRLSLAISGYVGKSLAFFGYLWLALAISGCITMWSICHKAKQSCLIYYSKSKVGHPVENYQTLLQTRTYTTYHIYEEISWATIFFLLQHNKISTKIWGIQISTQMLTSFMINRKLT